MSGSVLLPSFASLGLKLVDPLFVDLYRVGVNCQVFVLQYLGHQGVEQLSQRALPSRIPGINAALTVCTSRNDTGLAKSHAVAVSIMTHFFLIHFISAECNIPVVQGNALTSSFKLFYTKKRIQ